MAETPVELKNVESMPGSINQLISTNKRLRRPPSLSESFAWTPENIERANLVPLIPSSEKLSIVAEEQPIYHTSTEIVHYKYEKQIVEVVIKLLLHITLIGIFETLFYFLYVSSLENNGIEKTVNTFINNAANGCSNLSSLEIAVIDSILEPFINTTQVIWEGNQEEAMRAVYNQEISNRAWAYVGGLLGIFILTTGYIFKRKIAINWRYIILENVAMVILLALYELMFFNTIIYPYEPVSTDEIARNAVEKLQDSCGILTHP
jgi:hypothetical protein